jgi:lysozyme family protein
MADFMKSIEIILFFEGGFSNDRYDRGGKTRFGITELVARAHGYKGDMETLPLDAAKAIYKQDYWDALNLDKVFDQAVATEIFDIAVNMGTGYAGRVLQMALNYLNRNGENWQDLEIDGIIGEKTLEVVNGLPPHDQPYLMKIINGLQFERYVHIIRNDPRQEVFFRGWLKRV